MRYSIFFLFILISTLACFHTNGLVFAESSRVSIFREFSPDVDVVMIGDSITQFGLWSEFFPDKKIANRGIARNRSSDVKRRLDTIISTTPETAFLMIGINDLIKGVPVYEVENNIISIVNQLKLRGITVVVQSTLECSRKKCVDEINNDVKRLNTGIQKLLDNSVEFIDLNNFMSGGDGLKRGYTTDGIHLNGKGYRAWVDRLRMTGYF